jgi:hypothetical protein
LPKKSDHDNQNCNVFHPGKTHTVFLKHEHDGFVEDCVDYHPKVDHHTYRLPQLDGDEPAGNILKKLFWALIVVIAILLFDGMFYWIGGANLLYWLWAWIWFLGCGVLFFWYKFSPKPDRRFKTGQRDITVKGQIRNPWSENVFPDFPIQPRHALRMGLLMFILGLVHACNFGPPG